MSNEKFMKNWIWVVSIALIVRAAGNIFIPAISYMADDLHVDEAEATSNLNLYYIILAISYVALGPICDRFQKSKLLRWGLLGCLVGCLFSAFAPNIYVLNIGRSVQALAAGVTMLSSQLWISEHSDKKKMMGQLAWFSMVAALAPILAPVFGGFIADSLSWRYDFGLIALLSVPVYILTKDLKKGDVQIEEVRRSLSLRAVLRNPNTKIVAMQTLQRIVDNQSPTGGWDYGMNRKSTRDDMSYAGWALQALKAGKMAGMHPKGLDACIKKAIKCLKTRNFKNGGFNYTAGGGPTGLTATGCLAMQLLGYMNENEVKAALDTMRAWKPSFEGTKGKKLSEALPAANPQYYCYYAAQCKYQAGMCQGATPANVKAWQDWNLAMKALYPRTMITLPEKIPGPDGKPRAIGYWKFKDQTCGGEKATTMATCLAALQMMVYYRYLPTTQTKAAKAITSGDEDEGSKKKQSDELDIEVDI